MDFFGSQVFWTSLRLIQLVVAILVLGLSGYVINWWNKSWSTAAPKPLGFLLLSSLLTPFALTYLLVVPVHFMSSRLNYTGLIAFVEGSMALLWGASSISTAIFLTERMCFGKVCELGQAATVLGVFEWLAFTVSFGFSLAFTIRDYRGRYPVIAVSRYPVISVTTKGSEYV